MIGQVRALLREPEVIVATRRAAPAQEPRIIEAEVREALREFVGVWGELFPAEQARIVGLLVERIDVGVDGLDIRLRAEGLRQLLHDVRGNAQREAA